MRRNVATNSKALGERIVYRDGQLLAARDLGDGKHRDDLLRWLHVRHLHRTWGIANGFEVQGASGDSVVVVGPGYAVDVEGREILSSAAVSVSIPAAGGTANYVLTLNHLDNAPDRCRALDTNQAAQDEHPLFKWRTPPDVCFGPEVPVVNVKVCYGQIKGPLDFRVRRDVGRLVRPHIAAGSTEPGNSGWKGEPLLNSAVISLNVTVDTSAAGFTQTPQYFAVLTGDFESVQFSGSAWLSGAPAAFFLNSFCFVANNTPSGFTYKILGAATQNGPLMPKDAESRQWALHWLGLQTPDECPAPFVNSSVLKFFKHFAGAI